MAECKTKVFDVGVVKEWCGTFGEFLKTSLTPGCPPKPSDDPNAAAKWIVFQFQIMVLAQIIMCVYSFLAGGGVGAVIAGLSNVISLAITAWVQGWMFWFSFVKRDPNCCCIFVVTIEGWKYMHLLVGISFMLQGLSNALNALNLFSAMLSGGMGTDFIVFAVYVVFMVLYAVGMLGTGLCFVKIGSKKAGVEIPNVDASKVGA